MRNGLNVMTNQLQTSEKEIVVLKAEKEKLTNELEVVIKQNQNPKKKVSELNKNAPNRKNPISTENQRKKKKKKIELHNVSTSPSAAKKASGHSQVAYHAKSSQRVPPPSSQPKGDQRYSKGPQRFQQMHSYCGKIQGAGLVCAVQGGWTEPLELLVVGAGQQRLHLGGVLPQREDGVKGSERLWRPAGVAGPEKAFCCRRCPLPSSEWCTGCQSLHRLRTHPAYSSLLRRASSCIGSEDLFFFGQGDQPKGSEISLLEVPTTKEVSVPVAPSSDRETVVADQSEGGLEMEENVTKTRTHLNEAQLLLMKDMMNHNLQIKETEARETYAKAMQTEESFAQQKSYQIWLSLGDMNSKIFDAAFKDFNSSKISKTNLWGFEHMVHVPAQILQIFSDLKAQILSSQAKNDGKCAPSAHVDVHMTSAVEGQVVDQDVKCIIDCGDVSKV
ncbi:hypothetical protein Taro_000037, partial [Colocasia esculenta]|nr:hypothetical protein [Colocasia esculenta]